MVEHIEHMRANPRGDERLFRQIINAKFQKKNSKEEFLKF